LKNKKLQQKQQQSTGGEKKSTTINPLHCNRHRVVFAFSPCCQDLALLQHWLTACDDIVAEVDFPPFRAMLRTPLSHVYFSCSAMTCRSSMHANAMRYHHCNSQAVPHKLFFV